MAKSQVSQYRAVVEHCSASERCLRVEGLRIGPESTRRYNPVLTTPGGEEVSASTPLPTTAPASHDGQLPVQPGGAGRKAEAPDDTPQLSAQLSHRGVPKGTHGAAGGGLPGFLPPPPRTS